MINDDRVKIKLVYEMKPHPMSPCGEEDFGYQTVKNSIRQIWNNTHVAPGGFKGHVFQYLFLSILNITQLFLTLLRDPKQKNEKLDQR